MAAREQGAVDGEVGVTGRRADQRDRSIFDVGQQGILLGSIETVDFVDEEERAFSRHSQSIARGGQDIAQFFDAVQHSAELFEVAARFFGEELRQRSFSGAWRTEQDH